MKLPQFVIRFLKSRLWILLNEPPDEIIGPGVRSRKREGHVPVPKAFLKRWFVIRKNHVCNIYFHQFIRDDEDRALHDHPWFNLSIVLAGGYIEHTIDAGGVHKRHTFRPGDIKFRPPWAAHRVELHKYDGTIIPSWSLFITGPVQRGWGFHCPSRWKSQGQFAKDGGCDGDDYSPEGQLKGYRVYHHEN